MTSQQDKPRFFCDNCKADLGGLGQSLGTEANGEISHVFLACNKCKSYFSADISDKAIREKIDRIVKVREVRNAMALGETEEELDMVKDLDKLIRELTAEVTIDKAKLRGEWVVNGRLREV